MTATDAMQVKEALIECIRKKLDPSQTGIRRDCFNEAIEVIRTFDIAPYPAALDPVTVEALVERIYQAVYAANGCTINTNIKPAIRRALIGQPSGNASGGER